jgi:hypothetical protein
MKKFKKNIKTLISISESIIWIIFFLLVFNPFILKTQNIIEDDLAFINEIKNYSNIEDVLKNIDEKNLKDTVIFKFLKYKTEVNKENMVFNIITIKNFYDREISGNFELFVPEKWQILGAQNIQIKIAANDSLIIPIRTTLPKELRGGVAYPISCKYSIDKKNSFLGSYYILKQEYRNFEIFIDKKELIVDGITGAGEFNIKLVNKGNVSELIKLNIASGKLINIINFNNQRDFIYIPLEPGQDTLIPIKLWYQVPDYFDSEELNRRDLSIVKIQASNNSKTESSSVWCKYYPYKHVLNKSEFSPLNVSLMMSNLLADGIAAFNFNIWGGLILNENSNISYFLGAFNFNRNTLNNDFGFFFNRNLFFGLNYRYKKWSIRAGDRISPYQIPVFGRGISTTYFINKNNYINLTGARNNVNGNLGLGIHYKANFLKLPSFSISSGIMRNINQDITLRSIQFSSSIPFSNLISFNYGIRYINSEYGNLSNFPNQENSQLGYHIGLGLSKNNFRIKALYNNQPNLFFNSSNIERFNLNISNKFKDDSNIKVFFQGNRIQNGNLNNTNENFFFNSFYNGFGIYSKRVNNNFGLNFGPQFQYQSRINNLKFINTKRNVEGYSIRWNTTSNHKLSQGRSISVFFTPGLSFAEINNLNYLTNENNSLKSNAGFNYNLGGFYNSGKFLRLNVSYFYGPYFFIDQVDAINNERLQNKSLRIGPVFEKNYVYDDYSLKIGSYNNIMISMPGNREIYNFSVLSEYKNTKGWFFNVFANMYSSSFIDPERSDKKGFRSFSLNLMLKKTFGLRQKNLKYYDLEVICFKDLNGNGMREDNEPLLSNILIEIEKNNLINSLYSNKDFIQKQLVTNYDGIINYKNIPNGYYNLNISTFKNIGDIFPVNGYTQNLECNKNLIYYIPFVETYKIKGKVFLIRDEFSTYGNIDPGNVKITATSQNDGKIYTALTDKYGNFIINVPQSGIYLCEINNIFGNRFEIDNQKVYVDFNGYKLFEVNFIVKEKKRKISFLGNDESMISYTKESIETENQLNTGTNSTDSISPTNDYFVTKSDLDLRLNENVEKLKENILENVNNKLQKLSQKDVSKEEIKELKKEIDILKKDLKKAEKQGANILKSDKEKIKTKNIEKSNIQSYKDYEYNVFADKLEIAMKGIGTDSKSVYSIFELMKNEIDIVRLNEAFGIRNGEDLKTWLNNEWLLSINNINIILISNKINYKY